LTCFLTCGYFCNSGQNYFVEDPTIDLNPILLQAAPSTPFGSSIFGLIGHLSGTSLAILFLLLAFSVFSWTIILRKWLTFRQIDEKNRGFVALFRKSSRLSEIASASERFRGTPLSGIFNAGYQELNAQVQTLTPKNPDHPVLAERNFVGIQRALQRASAAELSVLENNMSWLATTGSVTPFIGLLGTVMGIMSAFLGLGEGTTSIQAVAPGIAEALIATAMGLFAAIPAVIAYNQFISRMKTIAAEMDDFSAELLNLVERSFS
jgi:biopolymer transport protein TolQ